MSQRMPMLDFESLVPDHIRCFEPYIPSRPDSELMKLYGCQRLLRLNNNENPLGPPAAARQMLRRFPPSKAALYPSGDAYHLRHKLGSMFDLHPDQFIIGNGANEVIGFAIQSFCQPGDNVITADKTFAVYEWVSDFCGLETRLIPIRGMGFDVEAIPNCIDDRTKLIFICNPNNPTGSYWNESTLRGFLKRIDGRQIVVLDEAYFEFVQQDDYPDGLRLIAEHPNLVVFRTFSKMYGLAGLRIGYLAGDKDVVDIVRRTCVVYSVNTVAQDAALCALDDHTHVRKTRELICAGKEMLFQNLERLGLDFVPGEGNFTMIKLPMSDSLAYRKLMAQGVMVRSMTGFRFPNHIRVSIGKPSEMQDFIEALARILPD